LTSVPLIRQPHSPHSNIGDTCICGNYQQIFTKFLVISLVTCLTSAGRNIFGVVLEGVYKIWRLHAHHYFSLQYAWNVHICIFFTFSHFWRGDFAPPPPHIPMPSPLNDSRAGYLWIYWHKNGSVETGKYPYIYKIQTTRCRTIMPNMTAICFKTQSLNPGDVNISSIHWTVIHLPAVSIYPLNVIDLIQQHQ